MHSTNVILDSGLSYALVPSKDIKAISSLLSKSQINCQPDEYDIKERGANLAFWKCTGCSSENYSHVDSLTISIGGKEF